MVASLHCHNWKASRKVERHININWSEGGMQLTLKKKLLSYNWYISTWSEEIREKIKSFLK